MTNIDEVHIVMRHYKQYSSVDKVFTLKEIALNYASEMQKLEISALPHNQQGTYTVITSKLENSYSIS